MFTPMIAGLKREYVQQNRMGIRGDVSRVVEHRLPYAFADKCFPNFKQRELQVVPGPAIEAHFGLWLLIIGRH